MTIAKNKHFVPINNALTVDLTGQVASESLGFAQHSATFAPGTVVTTPRSDVHYIATEYGIADLDCRTIPERVNRMINIAHPDFRDQLTREAVDSGLVNANMIKIDSKAA